MIAEMIIDMKREKVLPIINPVFKDKGWCTLRGRTVDSWPHWGETWTQKDQRIVYCQSS